MYVIILIILLFGIIKMKYINIIFKKLSLIFSIISGLVVGCAVYGTFLNFLNSSIFIESLIQDMTNFKIALSAFMGLALGMFTLIFMYLVINEKK